MLDERLCAPAAPSALPAAFPDVTFYLQAADMVTQISQFRASGADRRHEPSAMTALPISGCQGAATTSPRFPESRTRISSRKSTRRRSTQRSIGRAQRSWPQREHDRHQLNISLSSSEQVSPNFWTDPPPGFPTTSRFRRPSTNVSSLNDVGNTPVSARYRPRAPVPGLLSNVATLKRDSRADQHQSDQHPASI